jgi:hypothetical protein
MRVGAAGIKKLPMPGMQPAARPAVQTRRGDALAGLPALLNIKLAWPSCSGKKPWAKGSMGANRASGGAFRMAAHAMPF